MPRTTGRLLLALLAAYMTVLHAADAGHVAVAWPAWIPVYVLGPHGWPIAAWLVVAALALNPCRDAPG